MKFLRMTELDLAGRRLLIREDLNVPVEQGRITNERRIVAALPTLRLALERGAGALVLSHLGRPKEGVPDPAFSLAPVARRLGELLGREVPLVEHWLDGYEIVPGALALAENVRFLPGETRDDEELGRRMARLCDVYVMDAFGTAHRAHASTHAVARFAPVACAGPLLAAELDALGRALEHPERPLVAVVGGAKVSGKLEVLEALSARVDRLIVGGGIANTFLAAAGLPIGESLHEPELIPTAKRLLERLNPGLEGPESLRSPEARLPLPTDVVVAPDLDAPGRTVAVTDVGPRDRILDIGPETATRFAEIVGAARTIVWNGPVGVFERAQFSEGTRRLAQAIAASPAFSIAGGGDTLAAIDRFGVEEGISYISTGGGAFLEFLEGRRLPGVAVLEERAREMQPGT